MAKKYNLAETPEDYQPHQFKPVSPDKDQCIECTLNAAEHEPKKPKTGKPGRPTTPADWGM